MSDMPRLCTQQNLVTGAFVQQLLEPGNVFPEAREAWLKLRDHGKFVSLFCRMAAEEMD